MTPEELEIEVVSTKAALMEQRQRLVTLEDMWYDTHNIPRPTTMGKLGDNLEVTFYKRGRFYVHNGDWYGVYDGKRIFIEDTEDTIEGSTTFVMTKKPDPTFGVDTTGSTGGVHTSEDRARKLNQWVYLYIVRGDHVHYDRSYPRGSYSINEAKRRIVEYEKLGLESFYMIGATCSGAFY
jgi:hypothetical protein